MGKDNNRSIAIYRWGKDKKMSDMRIGVDKGHNDEVYALSYNPVTDHVVAVGKKFIRFFGIKVWLPHWSSFHATIFVPPVRGAHVSL